MKSYGFPRHLRLLNAGDFRHVFENNIAKSSNRHFLLLASHGKNESSRVGFVFSKKNVRRAVDRNRIKRLSREYFRNHLPDYASLDIVILARSGVATCDNASIHEQLSFLFDKLRDKYVRQAKKSTH